MQREPAETELWSSNWRKAVGLVAGGLVVAWAVLSLTGFWQAGTWPAAAAPFGLNRVLVVHLLGVLPLSLWCARGFGRSMGRRPAIVVGLVTVGLFTAVGSLAVAEPMRAAAEAASPAQCELLRLSWGWVLLFPWSAAAMACVQGTSTAPEKHAAAAAKSRDVTDHQHGVPRRWIVLMDGTLAALFALLPAVHVQQVLQRESALVSDAAINQQYLRAWQISQKLAVLGTATIAGQPTQGILEDLRSTVATLLKQVETPLPSSASDEQKLARASQLYSLGRFDDVEQILQTFADDPRAQLRLARVAEAQRDYAAAANRYARTLELLQLAAPLDAEQLGLLRSAYERRVNNLRRIGQSRRAEEELLAGLERWPSARDAFLIQLGFHYEMAGRTSEAIDYFQQAAEVNPRLRPQAEATLRRLQRQAEGCLLRRTQGATR